jgi:hypothetical protein
LTQLFGQLQERGINIEKIQKEIIDISAKLVVAVEAHLNHYYDIEMKTKDAKPLNKNCF